MKNILLFATAMVLAFALNGQNLVSNSDFSIKESGTGCPYGTGWDGAGEGAPEDWFDLNSTDYYHPCSTYNAPGNNFNGCELPKKGTAYTGALAYIYNEPYFSEYMWQELSSPLTINQTYYIEFWVSLAVESNFDIVSVKTLGMHLSSTIPTSNGNSSTPPEFHHLTPQIPNTFPASNFYSTTNGWQKIFGTFTPQTSGIKYILIGNFDSGLNNENSPNPTFQYVTGPSYRDERAYYYFDNVYIGTTPSNSETSVSGASVLCSTNSTYTLNNPPPQTAITWAVSPSSLVNTSSGSGASASIRANTSSSIGEATITFTSTNDTCSTSTNYSKTVHVGKPYVDGSSLSIGTNGSYGDSPFPCIDEWTYPGTTFYWEIPGSQRNSVKGEDDIYWNHGAYNATVSYWHDYGVNDQEWGLWMDLDNFNISSSGYSTFNAENSCGSVELASMGWGICYGGYYTIYPNPSRGVLNIDFIQQENPTIKLPEKSKTVSVDISIVDGNQVEKLTFKDCDLRGKSKLDISSLKPGIYYVKIRIDKNEETHRIVIE